MKIVCIDIDAQKGFSTLCPDELPIAGATEIVKALNEQAQLADFRIASKDVHPANAPWTEKEFKATPNVDLPWPAHCVAGTKGAQFLPGLKAENYGFIVYKGMEPDMHPYGACYHDLQENLSTGLIETLKLIKPNIVIIGGLATDYCVKTTALQIKKLGYITIVNLEACRGVAGDTIEKAINEMRANYILVKKTTKDVRKLVNKLKKFFKAFGLEN